MFLVIVLPPNTTTTPHHLLPFIPHSVTHPSTPPPSLFSVSVEPLWLHRYTDCWLCRGGGMLFWHSTRRYCTSSTLPLSHNLCTIRPPVLDQILKGDTLCLSLFLYIYNMSDLWIIESEHYYYSHWRPVTNMHLVAILRDTHVSNQIAQTGQPHLQWKQYVLLQGTLLQTSDCDHNDKRSA